MIRIRINDGLRGALSVGLVALTTLTVAAPAMGAPGSDGLSPAQIHAAYALPYTGAAHQRVGVVVAYDHPHLARDLAGYADEFGVKPCTVGAGCLRVVNQNAQSSPLPGGDPTGGTWDTEASLSSELVRAVCQSCSLVVAESNSDSKGDLAAATAAAAHAGATTIVTTFAPPEEETDARFAADFAPPRAVVVAATGDLGFGGGGTFPAAFPGVVAVGGTTMHLTAHGNYGGETAWSSTSTACSLYRSAPPWQATLAASAGCAGHRAIADLSAVADPGALVLITDAADPGGAWFQASGTSVAAPIIAGVIGLAGSAGGDEVRRIYAHAHSDASAFRDVLSGAVTGCTGQRICVARRGYDGPTGLGTPDGLAAFLASGGALSRGHQQISLAPATRLRSDRRWRIGFTVQNGNPFAVRGSLELQLGSHRRRLAVTNFALSPLGHRRYTVTVAGPARRLLAHGRTAQIVAQITARGPAGGTVAARLRRLLAVT